jgi:hypothetical protein
VRATASRVTAYTSAGVGRRNGGFVEVARFVQLSPVVVRSILDRLDRHVLAERAIAIREACHEHWVGCERARLPGADRTKAARKPGALAY